MNLKRIREISKERGISIRFLAKSTGFTEQTILRIIRENTARIQTIQKIADFFNLPVTYFMEDDLNMSIISEKTDQDKINIRLRKVMHHNELNQTQFATRIGIAQDRFNKILNNNIDFGVEVIQGVASAFPEINLRWLLIGSGEMNEKVLRAAEPVSDYGKICSECKKKDLQIEDLIDDKRRLKDFLDDCLKKVPEEKRKAS